MMRVKNCVDVESVVAVAAAPPPDNVNKVFVDKEDKEVLVEDIHEE